MDGASQLLFSPMIQWGFAGFCAVLLGILVWLVRAVLRSNDKGQELARELGHVIADNTATVRLLDRHSTDELALLRQIHDKLLSRPCMKE